MLRITLSGEAADPGVLAVPTDGERLIQTLVPLDPETTAQAEAFLAERDHKGTAGAIEVLPRPLRTPHRLLLVGVGAGTAGDWRTAAAAVVRAARREEAVTLAPPLSITPESVRTAIEGALLSAYRFSLKSDDHDGAAVSLRDFALILDNPGSYAVERATAEISAQVTGLARDLVNMPGQTKSPAWMADQVVQAVEGVPDLTVTVRGPEQLEAEGFGGILAVGGGSTRGPRLVQIAYRPDGASRHVVLVGKGVTFDTGGISIKPRDGMKLMRKDMAGAAAVIGAVLGAARMRLPVRVTALAPLAENMPSGAAYRPGDVVTHYGGITSEILNTDAEGRVVLADALAYAVARLAPDVIVDLATLTGAATVALGKRTAALFAGNDALATALAEAAAEAGERVWRMPMPDDYRDNLDGDVADLFNAPEVGAGSVMAALYLREFLGDARDRWAHLDMSAPAWSDTVDGEVPKGATGWGVRTLIAWLATL